MLSFRNPKRLYRIVPPKFGGPLKTTIAGFLAVSQTCNGVEQRSVGSPNLATSGGWRCRTMATFIDNATHSHDSPHKCENTNVFRGFRDLRPPESVRRCIRILLSFHYFLFTTVAQNDAAGSWFPSRVVSKQIVREAASGQARSS